MHDPNHRRPAPSNLVGIVPERPGALLLAMAVIVPLVAIGASDWIFTRFLARTPLFLDRPGFAALNFVMIAAPFVAFAVRGADIDSGREPDRARGLVIGGLAGAWFGLMLYGYLLVSAYLTPWGDVDALNLGAEGLVLAAPLVIGGVIHVVYEMVGGPGGSAASS